MGRELMKCADDAEAIAKAKLMVDVFDIELWSGARLVARISTGRSPKVRPPQSASGPVPDMNRLGKLKPLVGEP